MSSSNILTLKPLYRLEGLFFVDTLRELEASQVTIILQK
ncbi:unnamed protein product [Arabidopsis thaliana]|uniref:Uncharacterized protein n=3 Tax=Arabidopsis TaxID=3701 RepID=A0A654FCM8_ARATH|nr:uncharacterized protein AT3G15111 [Arabidopsis thaliana]AEE75620.1 hypothetical protein AT3G15111 [Arabidopsis thaliana]KAG7625299.1 hypothetical protein ISN45_At03g015440 [Arabidopsis thaliana x Arabidopsis arenosa]CAA0382487.1 unnamed protein product [Arabidopsis thaliana]VYS57432.1 unnamed protein product [Arabidopsis thaliana]|eukprot:NP_001118631.1 hypothetical protein AT3G15111 [Arabidopsis thaliana]